MVKVKESKKGGIGRDRYYIWSWRGDSRNKIVSEKKLYRKDVRGIG